MAYTKSEIKVIAPASPLPGFVSAAGTVTNADTVETAIEKLDGNVAANLTTVNNKINSSASNFTQSII